MHIKSRSELDLLAWEYASSWELRRGIRLGLHGNTADILLVIYWGMERTRTEKTIHHLLKLDWGRPALVEARSELMAFDGFNDPDVRQACENISYMIASALDEDWI